MISNVIGWRGVRRTAVAVGAAVLMASSAQAQFGGFLQSVIGAATQQAAQQATQSAPAASPYLGQAVPASQMNAAQANAIAATAAAIPMTDPEYQAMMAQSLASIPVTQRATLAPVIDAQVRQSIASRRLGFNGNMPATAAAAQAATANPQVQQALQGALMQGLANGNNAGYGNRLPTNLSGDAGKAAAAGALIQGLGSFFSRPTAPAVATAEPTGAALTPLAPAP